MIIPDESYWMLGALCLLMRRGVVWSQFADEATLGWTAADGALTINLQKAHHASTWTCISREHGEVR